MCWGDNEFGQIGNGTFGAVNVPTPTAVTGLSGVTELSTGGWHGCVRIGGAVQCWGLNDHGQIGANTTNLREPTPLTVIGVTNAAVLSSGDSHNCALQSGQPRCWGYNAFGQLGDGTTTDRSTAVKVPINTMTTLSAGYAHSCSRRYADGTLRCWGNNTFGELGNGTTTSSLVPVTVTGITGATTVTAAGGSYSCALLSSGAGRCWGYNGFGQLGNGTTTDSSVPVVVSGP
jgi:alpha-tubulin suppressor-like RCC1 family protein